ncbi:serine hydrolase domain-containing protein [Citromicrobium bathyomarinum]
MVKKLAMALALLSLVPLLGLTPQALLADEPEQSAPAASTNRQAVEMTPEDVGAWLDGLMPYALADGDIPGAVVTVVKDGKVLANKGYGYADLAKRKPVDPDTTLFRIGSISKLFTWTAVMQQVEAGRLDLDTDVNEYLDFEIPPYDGKPITLRQIMTHTAGFEESVRHLISSDPDDLLPLDEYVREALPARVFAPGTTPAYSNYATALAGYIVERVSGTPYHSYIEGKIFRPLGMSYASARQPLPDRLKPFASGGYQQMFGASEPFEIVIPEPAGSFSVSGADMAKFMIAHLENGGPLLKPETAKQMHDYRAPGLGPLNTMALGFYEQRINGRRSISHGGDTDFFHSDLWLFPGSDVGMFISMNSAGKDAAAYGLRGTIIHEFANRYFPAAKDPADVTPIDEETAREHAQMLAGTYVSSRGFFTNWLSVLGLLNATKIVVGPDGKISMPGLDLLSAGPRDWVEVEPFLWRDINSGERIAAEVKDGKVVRVSMDVVSPFMVLTPAPAGTNPAWLLPALLIALGIVAVAALAWPIRAIVRRRYKAEFALTERSLLAYRVTRAFCWLVLAVVLGWVMLVQAFSADSGALGGQLDWLLNLLRTFTPIAAFGLLGTAIWHLVLCFKGGRAWTMKLGAVLLVFAGAILCWVTITQNLYGYSMAY